ncbi:MAG TPA: alpha/beta hydrolase-fold protein [Acidobacteriaceae bacterium]|nr:alpha/beta hydrolase-fold protein [Acidobacteriaceae bacterium]
MATQPQPTTESVPPPCAPPHPRVRKHEHFKSRFLPSERDLWVYVPPGYEEDERRSYPLLVLQDGQNLFDPETAFIRGRTWRVAEQADAAIEAGDVEPLVIAGVANAGERRLAEYTPTRDWKLGGGEARLYGEMLIREVLPFLRERYRLQTSPAQTGLGGSSLGGLVSLWLGLQHPEIFGKLAVLSPSVWWNHRSIVRTVDEVAPALTQRPRVWLDVGDQEGRRTLADAERLHARLEAHGWQDEADVHFEIVSGGTHDEAAWAERVRPMLRFLFPAEVAR